MRSVYLAFPRLRLDNGRSIGNHRPPRHAVAVSARVEVHEASRPTSCPYCHGALGAREDVWECPRCSTRHHADCARTNGHCTILGCGATVTRTAAAWRLTPLTLMVGAFLVVV